jgi:putative transposase
MARRARIILPGEAHHVTQRGNRRQNVFFSPDDYRNYLRLLWTNAEIFKFDIWAYCLMPNHVHLLVVPECEKSLRDGISLLHQTYTRSVNDSKSWKGHLWQGRFFSCPVGPCGVAAVARYIELNPVRAAMCINASDYSWSSAKESCTGQLGKNGFAPIFAPGGTWAEYLAYEPLGDSDENLKSIRETVRIGRPFASEKYLEILEKRTGKILKPQKRGRKPMRPPIEIGRVAPN